MGLEIPPLIINMILESNPLKSIIVVSTWIGRIQKGGRVLLTEILLPRIARLASSCSTGNLLSNFNKRISSKSSNRTF